MIGTAVMDLFDHAMEKDAGGKPLAERLRPRRLEDFVGQEHVLGPGRGLRRAIEADQVPSLILWGPPGTGKTTLARIVAERTGATFVSFSAVMGGVKEIREIVQAARERRRMHRQATILFVDEIHRFSKAQQDAFLPHVEAGVVTLIGATTENPSFEINSALLSRCRVVTLRPLTEEEIAALVDRAAVAPEGLGGDLTVSAGARELFARFAFGDARRALNALEVSAAAARLAGRREILPADAEEALQHKALLYDKSGEEHYNVVSAFIKALRGSDPDAAVYYMVRMLEAGEDPRFVLRRMVIFASGPHRLRRRPQARQGEGRAPRTAQAPQRAHEAHGGARLRGRVPVPAQLRRPLRGRAVPPRRAPRRAGGDAFGERARGRARPASGGATGPLARRVARASGLRRPRVRLNSPAVLLPLRLSEDPCCS